MINQHREATRPISLEAGIAYSKAFGCPLSQISKRLSNLAAITNDLSHPTGPSNLLPEGQSAAYLTQRGTSPNGAATPQFARSFHVVRIFRLEAFMHNEINHNASDSVVEIPGEVGKNAFAIRVEDETMAQATPPISKGMLVIFDPDAQVKHMSIVLAGDPGTLPVIRQAIFDGPDIFLTAPHSGLPARRVERSAIRAVAVKAMIDLL